MDTGMLTIVTVIILAVCGFIFLAWTMLAVWESLANRKGSLFSSSVGSGLLEEPLSPEDCYDECMKKYDWDSRHVRACVAECHQ
ncbi:MAG: hypothetical protein LDL33_01250 [Desulfomonile sp.]|nr:hypothetical protein [Desulfomonile sp.]